MSAFVGRGVGFQTTANILIFAIWAGALGMEIRSVPGNQKENAKQNYIQSKIMVTGVESGGQAARAGVESGDVVVSIAGWQVSEHDQKTNVPLSPPLPLPRTRA